MTYQVADAFDNAAGLVDVSPQPATPNGIRYPQVRSSAGRGRQFVGFPVVDLVWSSLTREQYNAIMTAYGLSQTVASNEVTHAVRDNDDTFSNYNAVASYDLTARRAIAFWENLTIRLELIEALA